MGDNFSNTAVEQEEGKSDIQISDVIAWTFNHKMFIVLSVIVCLFLGCVYIYRSQPQYQRETSVMIRTDQSGNAEIGELATFSDLGIFNTGIDVFNEIEVFKSPVLMEKVVERLGINTSYKSKTWMGRVTDWYNNTPLKVDFVNPVKKYDDKDVRNVSLKVLPSADGKNFTLSEFKINGEKVDSEPVVVYANKAASTPLGELKVSTTLFFTEDAEKDAVIVEHSSVKSMAKNLMERLSVELVDKKATVINLNLTDNSAKRAEDILNNLVDVYNEEWVSYMSESAANTSKFINERLVVIEKELGLVDADIEKFKSKNQLLDITAETAQVTQESSKYSDASFQANNQLSIAKYIREYLLDQTKAFDLLPSNSGIDNDNVESQIGQYNKMLLDRQRLVDNSSNDNPLVSDLNNQLTLMRSTILRSVDNLIRTLEIQVDRIAAQENEIAGRISANPGKVRELLSIERQQKIKEELYLYLLQKREENELSASIVVNNTRLLKPATGSSAPIAPKKVMILAAAFILGLAIPYGYMFLVNMLDTTVRGRKDVESLPMPLIGEVPQEGAAISSRERIRKMLNLKKEEKLPVVMVKPHSRDIINEAYRVIRTNLDFMLNSSNGTQAVMVTSYNPGSGKTFTSINLAVCLALKENKRVALVDLDIRHATLSSVLGKTRKGVATYLNGSDDLDSVVVRGAFGTKNLDVIPVGMIPPNPSELLLDDRLDKLVEKLKADYDYVLLDCPPVGVVADSSIIARVANRTIFVIRVGVMDRRMLPDVETIYRENHYPGMAILLNGSRPSVGYGYSRYSYGYGRYGYGYGYGSEEDKKG